jgi:hypothetical protein
VKDFNKKKTAPGKNVAVARATRKTTQSQSVAGSGRLSTPGTQMSSTAIVSGTRP